MTEADALAPDATFAVEQGHEISQVPDGCVIYQPSRERVHFLNPTAVVVYELVAAGKPVAEIVAFLQDAFELADPPHDAVRACIESMSREQLITPCPSSPGP
jgi:hypothetical protein